MATEKRRQCGSGGVAVAAAMAPARRRIFGVAEGIGVKSGG